MDFNSVSIINYKNYFMKKMWRAGKLVGGHYEHHLKEIAEVCTLIIFEQKTT